ncbi:hypothetical protein BVRB_8g197000 [Beta vulgaris subsp. vulgaris]|nr:hypothetical protein BVRB_8g197000 [Beta vulgaris subsp. vulgaris]
MLHKCNHKQRCFNVLRSQKRDQDTACKTSAITSRGASMSLEKQGPPITFFWESLQSIKCELKGLNNWRNKVNSRYH